MARCYQWGMLGLISLVCFASWGFSQERAFKKVAILPEERRTALVIGNANYEEAPLRNPLNDANDMAAVLEEKGFVVTILTDATKREMESAIKQFGKTIQKGGVGLFFYAGHGMQVNGVNYLIPIETDIESEDDIPYEAVDANRVLSKMDTAGNALNLVFLDACRNNPFARSFRSGTKGLAQMDAPSGTLVSYATNPGNTAADGTGRNGVFTSHLLRQIKVPGLEVGMMMRQVRTGVREETGGLQIPWDSSSLEGIFYFTPPTEQLASDPEEADQPTVSETQVTTTTLRTVPVTTLPPRLVNEDELAQWLSVKHSQSQEAFQTFLEHYPESDFAPLARMRLKRLTQAQTP